MNTCIFLLVVVHRITMRTSEMRIPQHRRFAAKKKGYYRHPEAADESQTRDQGSPSPARAKPRKQIRGPHRHQASRQQLNFVPEAPRTLALVALHTPEHTHNQEPHGPNEFESRQCGDGPQDHGHVDGGARRLRLLGRAGL